MGKIIEEIEKVLLELVSEDLEGSREFLIEANKDFLDTLEKDTMRETLGILRAIKNSRIEYYKFINGITLIPIVNDTIAEGYRLYRDTRMSIEDQIMELLYQGETYNSIQAKLGCPSKSFIKKVIKDRNPDLYKILSDTKKLQKWRDEQFKKFNSEN